MMMSQIMSLKEYLIPTYNPLVLLLYSSLTKKSSFIGSFNTINFYSAQGLNFWAILYNKAVNSIEQE